MFFDCGRKLENQKGTHADILRTECTQKDSSPGNWTFTSMWPTAVNAVWLFFARQRWSGCVLFSHISLTGPSQSRHWLFSSLSSHFPPFYFRIAPISFPPLDSEAPLCACGLFMRTIDSPSEVWLEHRAESRRAATRDGMGEEKG